MPPTSMLEMIGMGEPPAGGPPMEEKPDNEGSKDYSGPEINLPKGYTPPEDSQEGEDVSVLCKIRIKPDGKACIVSVDGAKFDEEPQPQPKGEESVKVDTEDSGMSLGERIGKVRQKMKQSGY